MKKISYSLSGVMYLVSAFFIFKGYDRMTNYENPEGFFGDMVNAHVGGDAYNYIINGTHATSFFVLAALFVITGGTLLIFGKLSKDDKIKDAEVLANKHIDLDEKDQ